MFEQLAVVATVAVASFFFGYKYNAKVTADLALAHTFVNLKLAAVKAEVVKLEAEAWNAEKLILARIKALL